jgi:hypothetical protein
MANKRVLIVTYYWPPSGGSGVQRWLKFVKYLVRAGWEPYVFTPENPSFTIQDMSLEKDIPASVEVIRFPIWEPYKLFFKISKLFGKKNVQQTDFISTGRKTFFQKISSWIRGNLFIPDARVFWVKPSVEYLKDFLNRNQIHKIITTGPPHSVHLIGLKLKRTNPSLSWVADFRDPWSEWDLLDTLSLTNWAKKKHKRLEKEVLTVADKVITIAPYHVNLFQKLGGRDVDLITNGFDEDDFEKIETQRTNKFTIRHVGVVDELRDPRPVMYSIKNLCLAESRFQNDVVVEFIGKVNSAFKDFIEEDDVLRYVTQFTDQVQHSELLKIYGTTDLQLLVLAHTSIAAGNLPGKFFEYLASGNPILGIGPVDGDAAHILKQSNSGVIVDRDDSDGIKERLYQFYNQWKNNSILESNDVNKFSRKNLTDQLIVLLNSLESYNKQ